MVREISIPPDFTPGFVEVGGRIPKFQYQKSLKDELEEGGITRDECINLLKCMLYIRNLEDMICELGEMKGKYGPLKYLYIGATHLSIGQEGASTGAISVVNPDDLITSTHRGHGDALAKGYFAIKSMDDDGLKNLLVEDKEVLNLLELTIEGKDRESLEEDALKFYLFKAIAELFGKDSGWCKGRGGSMHIADFKRGHLGANAIVGGSMGMAVGSGVASRYFEDGKVTLCFVGDGAFNNGISHEAQNMACMAQFTNGLMSKRFGVPVIFCCINNQYGMSGQQRGEVTGVDFLAERCFGYNKAGMHAEIVNGMDVLAVRDATKRAVELARHGEGPAFLEFWCYRFKGHNLKDRLDTKEDERYRCFEDLKAWERFDPVEVFSKTLVENDILKEEDIENLRKEARKRNEDMAVKASSANSPEPKNIHFCLFSTSTSKNIPEEFKNAPILKKPRFVDRDQDVPITYREALKEALFQEMVRDRRVCMWGEDIAEYGGAYAVTEGLVDIFGRDRVFNTAISEVAIIGSGVGAALRGLRPVVEIMYIDFILQAMDQLANQAAKWKYMSGGQPHLPLTIRTTIGGGKGYAGQHSQSLEAVVAQFPGLKIAAPSNAFDAKGLLLSSIRDDNPVVFIEHQNLYADDLAKGKVPKEDYLIPLGKAKLVQEGKAVTVVSFSSMVSVAIKAARQLQEEGIEVELIDLRSLYPLDIDTVIQSVQKTAKLVIVHQAPQFMGFGAEIAAQVQEKAFDFLDAPIVRVAAPNTPPPSSPVLEKEFLPSEKNVIEAVKRVCG
ncbi:dehydrogenase E1 component subunit alpha/beta, partial [Candidatus Aerophobetes bacterium]|nr:dehydrogenase E1 component subunit alpha/beta [Candidatus Aerophobetes bacterium]